MKFFKLTLFFLLPILFFISCDKSESPEKEIDTAIKVASIDIIAEAESLLRGSTAQLVVTVLPANATDKTVTWSSSDETIATVSTNGLVTAISIGEVTISLKSNENQSINSSVTLEVNGSSTNEITSLSIDGIQGTVIADYKIGLQVAAGTDLTNLLPIIAHNGETISPSTDTPQNYIEPVTYTVTSESGEAQEWIVKVIAVQEPPSGVGFITTWITDNDGTTEDNQISIPTFPGENYNYNVDWGDSSADLDITEDVVHTYEIPGTYSIVVTGQFPRIYFDSQPYELKNDRKKLIAIDQWGDNEWKSMELAFTGCENMDILATDMPDLSSVFRMFYGFRFCSSLVGNPSIGQWDVSNVVSMAFLFGECSSFNQDIGPWDVSNALNLVGMFDKATSFNQDIGGWDVSSVKYLSLMFDDAHAFNQDIGNWDVSNVIAMRSVFGRATSFNQDISGWDVSQVEDFASMFYQASSFNQDIGIWDVGSATIMSTMLYEATSFNQDISGWDVSNVTDMNSMFGKTSKFNQDISAWNVSNVANMSSVFYEATGFNQNIGTWDVSNVTNMWGLFKGATSFDQDLGNWDVSSVTNMEDMFLDAGLSKVNYDSLLQSWNSLPSLQNGVLFNGGTSQYCSGETARQNIINTYGWTIIDAGKDCN